MSKLSKTIILMTEKEPNIKSPVKRENSLIPVNSKLSRSTNPKMAQNKVWVVSQRLEKHKGGTSEYHHSNLKYAKKVQFLGKLPHYTIFASKGKINIFEIFSIIAPIKWPAVGGEKISKMLILAFKVIVKPPVYPVLYFFSPKKL